MWKTQEKCYGDIQLLAANPKTKEDHTVLFSDVGNHLWTKDGIKASNEKVLAIIEMPNPEDIPGVRRLCDRVHYLARCTPNLAKDLVLTLASRPGVQFCMVVDISANQLDQFHLVLHYIQNDILSIFLELSTRRKLPSYIFIMQSRRITGTSGENGKVHIFLVKLESTPTIEATRVMEWDYPSPSVKIYNQTASVAVPEILEAYVKEKDGATDDREISPFIAVGNSLESCFVYRDVFDKCQGCLLEDTDINDVVTCCIVCDIDQDGELEVLIGTYGQVILIYKNNEEIEQWELYHSVTLPCPVLAMVHCDVMGDGTLQLIVMTTIGIHIFQADPWKLAGLLLSRMEKLCDQTYVNGYTSEELREK
ncbi:KICSTOR complex protein kaptin-like [Palaemon carinicauda]|uniref:KICSTOR complex protein kaptin-like n=1 Tax=Palaemon carinicauda TaxID=392227 RepID=UPI0035B5FA78